jgi:hypothetical protein
LRGSSTKGQSCADCIDQAIAQENARALGCVSSDTSPYLQELTAINQEKTPAEAGVLMRMKCVRRKELWNV